MRYDWATDLVPIISIDHMRYLELICRRSKVDTKNDTLRSCFALHEPMDRRAASPGTDDEAKSCTIFSMSWNEIEKRRSKLNLPNADTQIVLLWKNGNNGTA